MSEGQNFVGSIWINGLTQENVVGITWINGLIQTLLKMRSSDKGF